MRQILLIVLICSSSFADSKIQNYDSFIGKDWFGVYLQDNKIGYGFNELVRESENRLLMNTEMFLSLIMQGTAADMSFSDRRVYEGKSHRLVYSKFINSTEAGDIIVEGKLKNDNYEVIIDIAGLKTTKSLASPAETLDDKLKILAAASEGNLKPGDTFEFRSYEAEPPLTGSDIHLVRVEECKKAVINGIPTNIYELSDSLPALGIKSDFTVDNSGNILQESVASLNLLIKSEPEEIAKQLDKKYDLLSHSIIAAANGPASPKDVRRAIYIISGYDILSLPVSERTAISRFAPDSGKIEINQIQIGNCKRNVPFTDDSLQSYLKAEQLIQADDPRIIEKASMIVGAETDAYSIACLINNWVFKNIGKQFSPDISNALQTLNYGKGDCGEHSALAVALLRAAGIPSRIITGLAYSADNQGFAFHAWVEVFVGGWIQMDPTWGETNADATHIMLARGGLENQITAILNAVAGIEIHIVEFE
jgi:hypothetical protein